LRPSALELESGLDALEAQGENAFLTAQEESLLNIPASAAISDWAIVLASEPGLVEAQARRARLAPESAAVIFRKGAGFYVVVQSGNRRAVREAMRRLRPTHEGAYLISLAHWCGSMEASDGYIQCREASRT
jgi:hypothetical protein